MHPTARIVAYLASALAVPGVASPALAGIIAVSMFLARRRIVPVANMLWRARWLFLLIVLGSAYSLPGAAVWLELGMFSPTWEGIARGLNQALRLLCLFLLLDLLVLSIAREPQMAGLYGLLRPLHILGLDAARATLRLGLTLNIMERPPSQRLGLAALVTEVPADVGDDEVYLLPAIPWRIRDSAALLALCGGFILLWHYA